MGLFYTKCSQYEKGEEGCGLWWLRCWLLLLLCVGGGGDDDDEDDDDDA